MRVHSTYILTTEDAAADDEDEICRELCLWRASVLSTEKKTRFESKRYICDKYVINKNLTIPLVFETKTWMEAATALEGLQV